MLELDPILAPLRNDARFTAVIEKMKRDVEAQRLRATERGLLDMDALLVPSK